MNSSAPLWLRLALCCLWVALVYSKVIQQGKSDQLFGLETLSAKDLARQERTIDTNTYCMNDNGNKYQGTKDRTVNGILCQRWDTKEPQSHSVNDASLFPDDTLAAAENYCRNPDNETKPWCYTTKPDVRRQFCDIPTCSELTDEEILKIFREVFADIKGGLANMISLTDTYFRLRDSAWDMCNAGKKIGCDLETLLNQMRILYRSAKGLSVTEVRSMIAFKDITLSTYLEQLKLSRDFRALLGNIEFRLQTVIGVNQDLGQKLSNYFGSLANYDKTTLGFDVNFVSKRLTQLKAGSTNLWNKLEKKIAGILKLAITLVSFEVGERLATTAFEIARCFNPVAVVFGSCDPNRIFDRITALMNAIRNLQKAKHLTDALDKLVVKINELRDKFAMNEVQIRATQQIVMTFDTLNDEEKLEQTRIFLALAGRYEAYVTDQDLAYLMKSLKTITRSGCDLISTASGAATGALKNAIAAVSDNCLLINPDLAQLDSYYDDLFAFQFELNDVLSNLVRTNVAKVYSDRFETFGTQIDITTTVIGLMMDEVKLQKAAKAMCNFLEYKAGGMRPPICKHVFFSSSALQTLIAYKGSSSISTKNGYAYIPTSQSGEETNYIDTDALLKGEVVYFQLPINDTDWLKKYDWLPGDYNKQTAFTIERFDVHIPGLVCTTFADVPVQGSVEVKSKEATRLFAQRSPTYVLPSKEVKLQFEGKSLYCPPCSQVNIPVRDNTAPTKTKKSEQICVKSNGQIVVNENTLLPSMYATWEVKLRQESCAMMVNKSLGFKPMVTVGYTRLEISSNIDDCWTSPCKFDAPCTDGLFNYHCQCPPGATGKDCSIDVDECAGTNPCSHGSCVNTYGSYFCNCTGTGYKGKSCEVKEAVCNSNPCQNGGQCTGNTESYTCDCGGTGYEGTNCEHDINECAANTCKNGGRCTNTEGSYLCDCARTGFQGTNCDQDVNECRTNPCQHGGRCTNRPGSYYCNCVTGFHGSSCQYDVNECNNNPCQHGGKCINTVGSYMCNCDGTGYRGARCENDVNECETAQCYYGACRNLAGSYCCDCSGAGMHMFGQCFAQRNRC